MTQEELRNELIERTKREKQVYIAILLSRT